MSVGVCVRMEGDADRADLPQMMREMVVVMVMVTGLRPGTNSNSNSQHSSTAVVRMVTGLRAR